MRMDEEMEEEKEKGEVRGCGRKLEKLKKGEMRS